MDEKNLRTALLSQPVPDEHIAEERTWEAVRAAYLGREPVPRARRLPKRLLLLLALTALGVGLALSPAAPAIGGWIRDTVGRNDAPDTVAPMPEPLSLPAPGQLLVAAGAEILLVDPDGTQTALGTFQGASWSSRRLFVAAWTEGELVAIDPEANGFVHWTLSHEDIDDARWSASGFRLAYRSGSSLRVVVENGTGDHELASAVAKIAPAWRPGSQEIVAFVDAAGKLTVADADSGKVAWQTGSLPAPVGLAWTSDAVRLLVLSERQLRVFEAPRELAAVVRLPADTVGTAVAASPEGGDVAFTVFSPASGVGSMYVYDGKQTHIVFAGTGRLDDPIWSPDGRYLLVGWPGADQWVVAPAAPKQAPATMTDIASRFDAAGSDGSFPRIQGWCCATEAG